MADGIFIVADLFGAEADRIAELIREIDPKFANLYRPHVTLAGSSGVGVLPLGTPASEVREALQRVGDAVSPLDFTFGAPERFPATNIIVLPLPVHGPVRWLHDAIATCGLPFAAPKFAFTPHCTVHIFRTMQDETWQRARRFRVRAPIRVDRIQAYSAREPQRPVLLCDVTLRGSA
ncbi:MAG TPA: 2'-5' RNA ligase family protein [Gemmatimonadaceae bacterium]|nr:2'-5' RNA ligase family protein [Gemmatimonadaceae bacterium]